MGQTSTVAGPERPTLIERLLQLIPLPYTITALLVAFLLGSPAYYLAEYLGGVKLVFMSDAYWIFLQFLYTVVPFYAIIGVRFMRTRILAAEPSIDLMVPNGEQGYHLIFGRVSRSLEPFLLFLIVVSLPIFLNLPSMTNVPMIIFVLGTSIFQTFTYATLVWIYLSSIWGLHKLGKMQLKLKPYYEDKILGLRPIGSLAISIALVYFSAFTMVALLFVTSILAELAIFPFIVIGILLFFLPLYSVHAKMVEAKKKEEFVMSSRMARLANSVNESPRSEQTSLAELKEIMANDILGKKLGSVSTWPLDTAMLGRFTAIILSVMAIILSRYVSLALHI